MNDDSKRKELMSTVRKNSATLDSLFDQLTRALESEIQQLGRTSTSALIPAGLLENYYTCLETIMLRVSQYFENSLAAPRWHADLLDKMRIGIEGIRIELFDDQTYSQLVELLKFRHFRRYYFELEYDWDRIDFLVSVLKKAHPRVRGGIERFLAFLDELA